MKFRIIVAILTIAIIGLFASTIYLAFKLKTKNNENEKLLADYNAAGLTIEFLKSENSKKTLEYVKLIQEGTKSKWEIASDINSLNAYSKFVENCNDEEEDCHKTELQMAINKLLNAKGYVQMVETNGNELFTKVALSLEGEFIKFKSGSNVRYGPIGITDCETSSTEKTGDIVSTNQTVKLIERCETPGSKSIWAHIQYTN